MKKQHDEKCKPVVVTQLAYKKLREMIDANPKIDGSKMSMCEMASSLIVRAAEK